MNPNVVELKEENPNVKCVFCFKSAINEIEWGPMYSLEEITLHYFCMLFSCGLDQNGDDDEGILGFLLEDLRKEIKRGEKLKCRICHLNRATVGCYVKSCKSSFHFTCGVRNGTLHECVRFFSYCRSHAQQYRQQIPQDVSWECQVCFITVENNEDTREGCPVWAPCCKKRVFHRYCIQQYAQNSGYFFCCPLCRNVDDFTTAMKLAGVFVPEQDASWEREPMPGAYADTLPQHSTCNAEVCQCPKGVEYNSKKYDSSWKLIRCFGCGSSAIHRGCGPLIESPKWKCPDCVVILDEPTTRQSFTPLDDTEDVTSSENNAVEPSTSEEVSRVVNESEKLEEIHHDDNYSPPLSPITSRSFNLGVECEEYSGRLSNEKDHNKEVINFPTHGIVSKFNHKYYLAQKCSQIFQREPITTHHNGQKPITSMPCNGQRKLTKVGRHYQSDDDDDEYPDMNKRNKMGSNIISPTKSKKTSESKITTTTTGSSNNCMDKSYQVVSGDRKKIWKYRIPKRTSSSATVSSSMINNDEFPNAKQLSPSCHDATSAAGGDGQVLKNSVHGHAVVCIEID